MKLLKTIILLSAIASGAANAAITYIDANPTINTFDTATGSINTAWYANNATSDTGPIWGFRGSGTPNNANVLEGRSNNGTPDAPLTTRLSGLSDGNYDVWVFFWTTTSLWEINASLSPDATQTYSVNGGGNTTAPIAAATLDFTTAVDTIEGTTGMYGVNLGQATVTGGSSIDVLIEQLHVGGDDNTSRTWYDGVGYERVPANSVDLSSDTVASNAPPGTLVGYLSHGTDSADEFQLATTGTGPNSGDFQIAGTTNLRTAVWMDVASKDISIIALSNSTALVTNDFTINVTPAVAEDLVFVVSADVQNGAVDGTVVGTAQTVQSGATFSISGGREDLFFFDGADLKLTNSADWGGIGTTNYVTLQASTGSVTNELVVAASVVSGATSGTIFKFR